MLRLDRQDGKRGGVADERCPSFSSVCVGDAHEVRVRSFDARTAFPVFASYGTGEDCSGDPSYEGVGGSSRKLEERGRYGDAEAPMRGEAEGAK